MAKLLISKTNLLHNLSAICETAGVKPSEVIAVLKDNAYGHGMEHVAFILKKAGVKKVAVRNIEEARELTPHFTQIMVLRGYRKLDFTLDLEEKERISFSINDIKDIENIEEGINVDLKIDTGMHRNGIEPKDIRYAIMKIKQKNLKLKSVFTHFSRADELGTELYVQMDIFKKVKKEILELIKEYELPKPYFHSQSSNAVFRQKSVCKEHIRVGIALYGYTTLNESIFGKADLKPVASLWADKVASRSLKKGARLGYGGDFILEKDSVVSSYDLGYADNIFRMSNKIEIFTRDRELIVPKSTMDFILVLSNKDKICIFDDVRYIAKAYKTIPYEVLVRIPASIPREITK